MIDSNALANVPEWVGNIADKETMESTRQDMIHRRGKIWWFKNPGSVQSLMTQRIDMSAYLNLVQQVYQGAESKMGASRSAAGQTLSEDPTAPGVKTMALLQQSDAMIAMYIDELKPALDEMMKFLIKQDRQYMKLDKKKVLRTAVDSSQYESEVSRDDINFLDSDVKFVVRNQNVDNNMAIKAREAREDLTTYLAVPSIGSRPQSVRILLRNDMMAKGRYTIDEINQIVPTEQELQAEQVEIQRLAMVAQQKQQEAAQLTQGVQDMASKQQDEQMAMMKESMGQPAGTETPPAVVPPTA
jgi:NACalpha-BTF3-like transcription factor